ncbi:MAG: MlaD family protein [Saprospiraceae bacterium]
MSYEVKTGILAILAIALSLWGIKYIQGTNMFNKTKTLYAYFDDAGGVEVGTPVQISGVTVGSVANKELGVEDKRVRLTLVLERTEVPLPKDAKAVLASTSMLGDMAILLEYDAPCNGSNCAEEGDVLTGKVRLILETMLGDGGIAAQMEEIKNGMRGIIDTLNSALLSEESTGPLAESVRDMQQTMYNLKASTGQLNTMLQRTSPQLERSLANVADLTATLEEQRGNIASILVNADSLSQQMVDANLGEAVDSAKKTLAQLNEAITAAKSALGGVDELVGQIKQGDGTLGLLIQDQELYHNLSALTYSLDSLMADFQDKPYRYMPLKSRRKVQKYDAQDGKQ